MDKSISIEGMDKNEAITTLIGSGLDFKAANKYWIENRPEAGSGFRVRFLDELVKGEMDEKAFVDFLKTESKNVQRNAKWFNKIRVSVNLVRVEAREAAKK